MAISAFDIAISQIYQTIPPELVELAFQGTSRLNVLGVPTHQLIIERVIHARVLKDCNLMGGKPKLISLTHNFMERVSIGPSDWTANHTNGQVYRIPPETRDYVPITEVHSCHFPGFVSGTPGLYQDRQGINLINLAHGVLQAQTFPSHPPTPTPELMAGDLVRLNPPRHFGIEWILSCRVGYDQQLMNLNTSAIKPFADLVEQATKAYIYNTLIIKLDQGFVAGGAEIGSVLRIVESYADAEQRYRELLDQFSGSTKLDPGTLSTLLKYAI